MPVLEQLIDGFAQLINRYRFQVIDKPYAHAFSLAARPAIQASPDRVRREKTSGKARDYKPMGNRH